MNSDGVQHNKPRAGQGGRPRIFQDEDFFRAVTSILERFGETGLTVEAVARELECSGTAVVRRFGSKRGLIAAYLEWALDNMTARFRAVRAEHTSPLAALRARGVIPARLRTEEVGDPGDPDHQANMATFWTASRADPALRTIHDHHLQLADREVAELLRVAFAAGELQACDPDALARALTAAWSGATTFWPGDSGEESLEERLGSLFDIIIDPYRVSADQQAPPTAQVETSA
jgi:AcrR family transcriptional regulator